MPELITIRPINDDDRMESDQEERKAADEFESEIEEMWEREDR